MVLTILGIHAATGEIAAGPDLLSRGFLLEGSNQPLLQDARTAILTALEDQRRNLAGISSRFRKRYAVRSSISSTGASTARAYCHCDLLGFMSS